MARPVHLGRLESTAAGTPVLAGTVFATGWRRLDYLVLAPGQALALRLREQVEEGYVVLGGTAALSAGGAQVAVGGPAVLRCGAGREHGLANVGPQPLQLLHLQVALEQGAGGAPALLAETVDRSRLEWRPAIHGGVGRVATRHLWDPEDPGSCWTFADHAVLDARSSVGYHRHGALEECFVVLAGRGYMTIDGETYAAGPGDVTWQGIGQAHGLYNASDRELEFLRLAVRQAGERVTTVDLHDDLAGCLPGNEARGGNPAMNGAATDSGSSPEEH